MGNQEFPKEKKKKDLSMNFRKTPELEMKKMKVPQSCGMTDIN